jgi:hypothetical protein
MSRYNMTQKDRSGSLFGPTRSRDLGRSMSKGEANHALERAARDSGYGRSIEVKDGSGRVVGKAERGRVTQRIR